MAGKKNCNVLLVHRKLHCMKLRHEEIWVVGICGTGGDHPFNPVLHGIGKQEKCSFLEKPRGNFYKTL